MLFRFFWWFCSSLNSYPLKQLQQLLLPFFYCSTLSDMFLDRYLEVRHVRHCPQNALPTHGSTWLMWPLTAQIGLLIHTLVCNARRWTCGGNQWRSSLLLARCCAHSPTALSPSQLIFIIIIIIAGFQCWISAAPQTRQRGAACDRSSPSSGWGRPAPGALVAAQAGAECAGGTEAAA